MVADEQGPYVSVDDYLAMERVSPIKHEYANGRVYAMSGGSLDHSRIGRNAVSLLEEHLDGTECEALNSDIQVMVTPTIYRYPDAVVTCDKRDRSRGQAMQIAHPRLIVEVLSVTTEAADRGRKFREYCQIPEFEEYLLLDSTRLAADHLRRAQAGPGDPWLIRSYGPGDTISLESIGLTVPLVAFYRRTDLLRGD